MSHPFDATSNLAITTVATAPSPATSGTSLVVASGKGSIFPAADGAGANEFNATVWPSGETPNSTNAEIVRVTEVATDTLTITRAQESTSAISIGVGYNIAATITAKVIDDILDQLNYTNSWGVDALVNVDLDGVIDITSPSLMPNGATWALLPGTQTDPDTEGIWLGQAVGATPAQALHIGNIGDHGVVYSGAVFTSTGQLPTSPDTGFYLLYNDLGSGWILATPKASQISYDNSTSGLTATDVQAAIDELAP